MPCHRFGVNRTGDTAIISTIRLNFIDFSMRILILFFLYLFLNSNFYSYAAEALEEEASEYSVTTKSGLHFTVPDDWPIVKRKGLTAPISIEEFVYKRFNEIESKIDSFSSGLSSELDKVKSGVENTQGDTTAKLDEIKSYISSMEEGIRELIKTFESLKADYVSLNYSTHNELKAYNEQLKTFTDEFANIEQSLYLINNELEAIKREKRLEPQKGLK